VRRPGASLRPGCSTAVAGSVALTDACAGGRSRKNIRDAKKEQAREINERIANWRDKNGKQTVSRAEVSRHNRKVLAPARATVRVLLAACASAGRRACKLTQAAAALPWASERRMGHCRRGGVRRDGLH